MYGSIGEKGAIFVATRAVRSSTLLSSPLRDSHSILVLTYQHPRHSCHSLSQLEAMRARFDALVRQSGEREGAIENLKRATSASTDLQLEVTALKKALEKEQKARDDVEAERSAAEARATEFSRRLIATSADLDIVRKEVEEANEAGRCLQAAMESLREEREAEVRETRERKGALRSKLESNTALSSSA